MSEEFSVYYLKRAEWDEDSESWVYRVRWAPRWRESDNTTEPECNLDCDDLLARFWYRFGGETVKSKGKNKVYTFRKEWIAEEKALYRSEYPDTVPTPPLSPDFVPSDVDSDVEDIQKMALDGLFSSPPPTKPGKKRKDSKKRTREFGINEEAELSAASSSQSKSKERQKKRQKIRGGAGESSKSQKAPLSALGSASIHKTKSLVQGERTGNTSHPTVVRTITNTKPKIKIKPLLANTLSLDSSRQNETMTPSSSSSTDPKHEVPKQLAVSSGKSIQPPSGAGSDLATQMGRTNLKETTRPTRPTLQVLTDPNQIVETSSGSQQNTNSNETLVRPTEATHHLLSTVPTPSTSLASPAVSATRSANQLPSPLVKAASSIGAVTTIPVKVDKHRGNRIQMIDPSKDLSPMGLSTKAKAAAPRTASLKKPKPYTEKKSSALGLGGLKFSKKSTGNTDAASSSQLLPESSAPIEPWASAQLVQSPVDHEMDLPLPEHQTTLSPVASPRASEAIQLQDFLNEIVDENPAFFGEEAWSGELSFCAEDGISSIAASLKNASQPLGTGTPPFQVLVGRLRIIVEKTYSAEAFMSLIRPAYGPPLQHAVVAGETTLHRQSLDGLTNFLRDTNQLGMALLQSEKGYDKTHSMTFFSSETTSLCDHFSIPADLVGLKNTMLVVLTKQSCPVPLNLDTPAATKSSLTKVQPTKPQDSEPWNACLHELGLPRNVCHMGILQVRPQDLQVFQNKQYCLYPDEDSAVTSVETLALESLMKAVGALRRPCKDSSARIIFIHVKGFSMLDQLDGLRERRRSPQYSFYTYGWDPNVMVESARLHSVYGLGGIVTFTARAIIENPYEAYQIIKKIEKDPFWDVFVLPSVVALIDELANETDATGHKYDAVDALSLLLHNRACSQLFIGNHLLPRGNTSSIGDWLLGKCLLNQPDAINVLKACKTMLIDTYGKASPKQPISDGWGAAPLVLGDGWGSFLQTDNWARVDDNATGHLWGSNIAEPTKASDFNTGGASLWSQDNHSLSKYQESTSAKPASSDQEKKIPPGLELWSAGAMEGELARLEKRVDEDILAEMRAIQLDPTLMSNYRRFVVLVPPDRVVRDLTVECKTIKDFELGPLSIDKVARGNEQRREARSKK